MAQANKVNPADRYAPADFFVRQREDLRTKGMRCADLEASVLIERTPTVEEFTDLRKSVGWGIPDPTYIRRGLKNSSYAVCAVLN